MKRDRQRESGQRHQIQPRHYKQHRWAPPTPPYNQSFRIRHPARQLQRCRHTHQSEVTPSLTYSLTERFKEWLLTFIGGGGGHLHHTHSFNSSYPPAKPPSQATTTLTPNVVMATLTTIKGITHSSRMHERNPYVLIALLRSGPSLLVTERLQQWGNVACAPVSL